MCWRPGISFWKGRRRISRKTRGSAKPIWGSSSVRDKHLRLVVSVIFLALVSSACDKSPAERPARLLEQAASWAAATRYGDQLHAKGEVPAAYLTNIADAGAD